MLQDENAFECNTTDGNGWIDINLPWGRNKEVDAQAKRQRRQIAKLYDKAGRKAEQTLGQTRQEAAAKLTAVRAANLRLKRPGWTESELIYAGDLDKAKKRYPLLDVNVLKDPPDVCDVTWLTQVKQVAKRNPVALAMGEYYHYQYQHWLLSGGTAECKQAEVLECALQDKIKTSVFRSVLGCHPLCRPGVLLEVQRHKTKEVVQLLIGHMGPYGGEDLAEMGPQIVEDDDMVLRAKVVWEEA
ncbi:MAG: hypothetical protein WC505_07740 [Patescibacteria group bacterium]